MAARQRAQERDYNRRRWMILDKGIDRAYNQKDTALGECLLKWNIREETLLERRRRLLQRQGDISVGMREQEKKLFVVTRDQAQREPTLLLERTPSAEQYPDYVDLRQPRYMRPLNSRQSKTPEFSTFSVFQAVKKRKRNPWEEAIKETVQFRPTLCPCARLNSQDTEKLLMDWVVVNEKQTKALGLKSDNRSAPIKHVRTGSNPLNLPSRLNSRLHRLAGDKLDDMGASATDSDGNSDDGESAAGSADRESADDEADVQQAPVFVTQLPPTSQLPSTQPKQQQQQQQQHHQWLLETQQSRRTEQQQQQLQHDLIVFEDQDNSKKEKLLAQKRQVDSALVSIYEMLESRRLAGRPRITRAHRLLAPGSAVSTGTASTALSTDRAAQSTPASAAQYRQSAGSSSPQLMRVRITQRMAGDELAQQQQQQQQQLRTTCRTAESINILRGAKTRPTAMSAGQLQQH